jgi:[ribosomal protein S18]-alanine N-acetyltransferase
VSGDAGPARGVVIRRLEGRAEAEACAAMMAGSEPWITLGRGFEDCLALMEHPEREHHVALDGEELAGFLVLSMRGAFAGYIQSVCVAPGARGRGVGTALVRFAEARIFRESPNVFLCVSSFNDGARRLYERLGYVFVGELEDYIVTGHSERLYRKSIGPIAGFRPGRGAAIGAAAFSEGRP